MRKSGMGLSRYVVNLHRGLSACQAGHQLSANRGGRPRSALVLNPYQQSHGLAGVFEALRLRPQPLPECTSGE